MEFDDIASLLDEPIPDPIPGQVDESDAPNAGMAEMAEEHKEARNPERNMESDGTQIDN